MSASESIDKRKFGYQSRQAAILHKLQAAISKSNDPKTICELFYVCCDGIKNRAITITNEVKTQLINWFVSQPTFIKALYPDFMWEV